MKTARRVVLLSSAVFFGLAINSNWLDPTATHGPLKNLLRIIGQGYRTVAVEFGGQRKTWVDVGNLMEKFQGLQPKAGPGSGAKAQEGKQ